MLTLPHELPASLSHVGLENPESLAEALDTIELRSLQDIRMLDAGEIFGFCTNLQFNSTFKNSNPFQTQKKSATAVLVFQTLLVIIRKLYH